MTMGTRPPMNTNLIAKVENIKSEIPQFSDIKYYIGPVPRQLRVESAANCNMHCIACHGYANTNTKIPGGKGMLRQKGLMSIELWEKVLQDAATWPTPPVEFCPTHFGEIFMNSSWYKMLKMVESYLPKTRIALPTTGVLLNDDKLIQLADIKTLGWLNWSLNAYFGETYERVHDIPAKMLAKVEGHIKKFRDLRGDVVQNIGFFYDSAWQSETERILFENYWRSQGFQVSVSIASFANNPLRAPAHVLTLACHSLPDALTVFNDGRVGTGCCFDADADVQLNIGKFPEEKLLDIWRGGKLRNLMELHNSGRRSEITICKGCTFA